MKEKSKILFILPSLKAGGAERVISFIAQNLNKERFDPILLVIGYEKDSVYDVSNLVVHYLNRQRVLHSFRGIYKSIRTFQPDLVITSIAHLTAITVLQSLYFKKVKFVAREANIKKITKVYHQNRIPFGKTLNRISYKLLDAIICQSKDMAEELIELRPKTKAKVHIINNPITINKPVQLAENKDAKPRFITIGRLHDEKGHNRLLDALRLLEFDFEYVIIGTGPHKASIQEKAERLNLSEKISWIDYTNDVPSQLIKSNIFLQGSYAEGFPNALLESCAVGTPVIAYNCPGGTSEIVINGSNGYLVDSSEELKTRIEDLINLPLSRENIIASVEQKFGKELILSQYESLFKELINNA